MFPVADDFAAIARRLREIQAEVANGRIATETPGQADNNGQFEPNEAYEDMAACA